jgi:hypothetical protein
MNELPGESEIDREQCFLLFANFCGDITRTAHAANVPEAAILKMCDEESWHTKLGPILALKKSTRPGDVERALNRAQNFVQAHRMRLFVARVIHRVSGMNEGEFNEYLFQGTKDKQGNETRKLTTRAIADLAVAMEKAQAMTYLALNDTAQDRAKRKETGDDVEVSAGDLHARIAEGIAAVKASATPRAQLFDAQLAQAQAIVKECAKPVSPNDSDDH